MVNFLSEAEQLNAEIDYYCLILLMIDSNIALASSSTYECLVLLFEESLIY